MTKTSHEGDHIMAPQATFIPNYEEEYLLAQAIEQYHAECAAQIAADLAPRYYAHYKDVPVDAMLVGIWALLTTPETDGALTVNATDPALILHGRKDLADAQRAADAARGGHAAIVCGYGR
jgi:hypothetical protein